MNIWKRFLTYCLCCVLVLSQMACANIRGKIDDGEFPSSVEDYVYVAEYKSIDGVDSLKNAVMHENQMYYLIQPDMAQNSPAQNDIESLCVMDLATLESKDIPFQKDGAESIYTMAIGPENGLWIVTTRQDESGTTPMQQYVLLKIDSSGQEVLRKDMTTMLAASDDSEYSLYPQRLCVDGDGHVHMLLSGMRRSWWYWIRKDRYCLNYRTWIGSMTCVRASMEESLPMDLITAATVDICCGR